MIQYIEDCLADFKNTYKRLFDEETTQASKVMPKDQ
jgi:hypothetical protein